MREWHIDHGSEFPNRHLIPSCRREGIHVTRDRGYRKNDQAWVEQKNWLAELTDKVLGPHTQDHGLGFFDPPLLVDRRYLLLSALFRVAPFEPPPFGAFTRRTQRELHAAHAVHWDMTQVAARGIKKDRESIRIPYYLPVSFLVAGMTGMPPDEVHSRGEILNISQGGIGIRAKKRALKEGTVVQVWIPMTDPPVTLQALTQVQWEMEDPLGVSRIGLRFAL